MAGFGEFVSGHQWGTDYAALLCTGASAGSPHCKGITPAVLPPPEPVYGCIGPKGPKPCSKQWLSSVSSMFTRPIISEPQQAPSLQKQAFSSCKDLLQD
eukprot:GABU01008088.1.p2 GENE.GABU01008088.1~~GABU01008088.1.p2  ORF type:complete len:106 (-),score=5.78 GABU01008088.1:65-361(-)